MRSLLFRCVVAILLVCAAVSAQSTFATITGTVMDASGAVVPNAEIKVTNTATGAETTAKSDEVGAYTVAQLKEGTYTLKAVGAGFKEFIVENIGLVSQAVRRVDVRLEVGATGTTVEVSGGATLIETENARISDTKTGTTLKTIPMNARWIWAFVTLSPGVVGGNDGYRFSGSLGNQSNWSIDGGTMNDGAGYQIGPLANYIESFQEVRIDSANNTAEFGAVGQVTIISKSGTNQFHGGAFDYYRTPGLRARNFFGDSVSASRSHFLGGSFSGPVKLPKVYNGTNKTFFYTSYETSRGSSANDFLNPSVPLQSWRQGDFSNLRDEAGALIPIYDPTTGQPFANNKIPAGRINEVSKKFQDRFYPLPNFGDPNVFQSSNYRERKVRSWNPSTYMVGRIDHRFSDRDQIYGRITGTSARNDVWEGNLPTVGQRDQHRTTRAVNITHTHTFSPTLLNEFRWGMNLNNNPIKGPINGPELIQDFGLVGLAPGLPDIAGIYKVRWSGISLATPDQYNYSNPGYRNHNETFQNYVSWFRNRHSFRFGIDLTRAELDEMYAPDALFGVGTFSSRFTSLGKAGEVGGHPYADFLLGIPTTAQRAFPPVRLDRNRWQYAAFVTDDFRVSPKLTLSLGMRYQLHTPWRENHNLISMFDIGSGSIVVPDGSLTKVSPLFPQDFAKIVEAKSVGFDSRTLIQSERFKFAPRLAAAYRPFGNNTVFRAGWGVFYDVAPWELDTGAMPYILNEAPYTNPVDNPTVTFPRVFPVGGNTGSGVALPTAYNPELKLPYTMQYNFTFEQQIKNTGISVSYIGTAQRKGTFAYNYNAPQPDNRLYVDKPRPYMQYGDIYYRTNGTGHQYNGLTTVVNRQMSKGLYFQTSWTWARDIYDLSRWDTPENPFDRKRERAVAPDIPTHRAGANMVYYLPVGKGRMFLGNSGKVTNFLVDGWVYSATYGFHSGRFLTPYWSGPDPTGVYYSSDNSPAQVTIRPDQLRDPNISNPTISNWFDANAFGAPQKGRFGTSAKGVIKGPHSNSWNMGLAKETKLSERGPTIRMEIQGRNIFNHPNWSNPATDISDPGSVGRITWAGGISDDSFEREFQLGLRVEF